MSPLLKTTPVLSWAAIAMGLTPLRLGPGRLYLNPAQISHKHLHLFSQVRVTIDFRVSLYRDLLRGSTEALSPHKNKH